jgi:hypothetical protein
MNPWQRRDIAERLETEGAAVTLPDYPDWVFRVRRRCAWNADYQRAIVRASASPDAAKLLAWQRDNPGEPLPADLAAIDVRMMREAFAEGCVAGWSGVTDRDGDEMECTPENAAALLEHFPDIFAALNEAAGDASRFRPIDAKAMADAAAGN